MPGSKRLQRTADQILSGALQAETVTEGLDLIYNVVIAWAKQAPLAEVFAFNEKKLDRERSAELIRQFPARAYLQYWDEDRLRSEPVFILSQRLMGRKYEPGPLPSPPFAQNSPSETNIQEIGQVLSGELTIEQAISFFEELIVRFARLVGREKAWRATEDGSLPDGWKEEDAFRAVFIVLYYHIIEPMSAHGLF